MFAEKSVIFNFCEILFQIKDDLYKQFDDGDWVINRVCLLWARWYSEYKVVGNLSFRILKASMKLW